MTYIRNSGEQAVAENLLSPDEFANAVNIRSRDEVGRTDQGGQALLATARQAIHRMQEEGISVVTPAYIAHIALSNRDPRVQYGLLDLANVAFGSEFRATARQLMLEAQDEAIDRNEAAR